MEEIPINEEDIIQLVSIELYEVMIEGESSEEIWAQSGDRKDYAELVFKQEMRKLRRNCVSDSSQKNYISPIVSMITFFMKMKKMRLILLKRETNRIIVEYVQRIKKRIHDQIIYMYE